ncbi:MAG TPA: hypothetical protein VK974_09675 [Methylophilaceae bacterium]|nr:hypothetical protein [Methylophilaceae bacterium]
MKALFSGNMIKGMKLVGVYADEDCAKIASYLKAHPENSDVLDSTHLELTQFVDLTPPMAASIYGEIPQDQCVILATGSLTRGLRAVGPYPDRSVALSNAVSLTFGSKSSNYFSVEIEAEYEPLRVSLKKVISS